MKKIIYWIEDTWDITKEIGCELLCKIFGHPRPLKRKLWCWICPRCSHVVPND